MKDAGFVDVQVEEFKWSFSAERWDEYPDSDEVGKYTVDGLQGTLVGYLRRMLKADGGYNAKEIDDLAEECARTTLGMGVGGHAKFRVAFGRKP